VINFRRSLFAALLSIALPTATFAQATIEGRVELPKTHSAPVMSKRYEVVTKGGVLATNPPVAVVYLEGEFANAKSAGRKQVAQKDLNFAPGLLAVQTGTTVEFPNEDDTYHNIFSYSPAKRFDLGRYRKDEQPVPSQTFDTPGLITLRCDIHEHMRGLVLVVSTPHFVITDPDGRYRLTGLPPGRYVLKAWVDSRTTREQPVEIKSGGTLHVDFP
jgi:plastocyanin